MSREAVLRELRELLDRLGIDIVKEIYIDPDADKDAEYYIRYKGHEFTIDELIDEEEDESMG